MTVKRSWLRRIGCTLPGIGLAGWLAWTGLRAPAQDPGASTTTRSYLNKTTISLPIVVDERHRAQLRNVLLYVKEGATQPWKLCDKATPAQTSFTYRATAGEGEYWFNIVSVDNNGRMTPADVTKEAPALIVVIDTQAPQLDVYPLENTPEGQFVRADWRDQNLDTVKSRVYYQTADTMWRQVEVHPGKANNAFRIPSQANWNGNLRAVAVDLAGNTTTRERTLGASGAAAAAPSVPNQVALNPAPPANTLANNVVLPAVPGAPVQRIENTRLPEKTDIVLPPPPPGSETIVAIDPPPILPAPQKIENTRLPEKTEIVLPPMPRSNETNVAIETPPMPPAPIVGSQAAPPSVAPLPMMTTVEGQGAPRKNPAEVITQKVAPPQLFDPAVAARAQTIPARPEVKQANFESASLQRQFASSSRVFLDYRIEDQGASGVGKVEVWYTRDQGQSWQKLCDDTDRQSPAEINLPGDGIYGVSLVISNGRGFGGAAPHPGQTPDSWIEVDTSRPFADELQVRLGGAEDSGALHVVWNTRDKNLGDDPVELYYAGSREGPWHRIAKGLKNEGSYRWVPPVEVGAQAFIRLTVRDLANNVATAETSQPIPLDDASRPRGRVLNFSTSPPRANPLPTTP